jgi:hypothetical protein
VGDPAAHGDDVVRRDGRSIESSDADKTTHRASDDYRKEQPTD